MVAPASVSARANKDKLRAFRAELTEIIPWVYVLRRPRKRCDGLTSKYWRLGFKTRHKMTPEVVDTYRCTRPGFFRFRALKGFMGGKNGTYCEIHLRMYGIFSTMSEEQRFTKWMLDNTEVVNRIRIKNGLDPMPTAEEVERARRARSSA